MRRVRPETFADHYSQARQFYVSQTPVERAHIAKAFVFQLGKCEQVPIRLRMVANLRNVDDGLAASVAAGLGLDELPAASRAARPPITDLPPSGALSIIETARRRSPGARWAARHRRIRCRDASRAARRDRGRRRPPS